MIPHVHSLKVLAARQVVMNRMDYSTYLNGATKDELDRLDNLEGNYRIQYSTLTIEAHDDGEKLPSDDWEYFKWCYFIKGSFCNFGLPLSLIKFMESVPEFTIRESTDGLRTWHAFDKWGKDWKKEFFAASRDLSYNPQLGKWSQCDDFIEDGRLVSVVKMYQVNKIGEIENVFNSRDIITTDEEGDLIWDFTWTLPKYNVKITKVTKAYKLQQYNVIDLNTIG